MTEVKVYMGYDLFNDVDDMEARDRNRGVVLLNIYQDHCKGQDQTLDAIGVSAILGYFAQIPTGEKGSALEYFSALCKHNGYFGAVTEH